MSKSSKSPEAMTQRNETAVSEAEARANSGFSTKWLLGMALGSAAGAALLVSSISSTTAEAPVVADGSHLVKTSNKVEKKATAKPKKRESEPKDNNSNATDSQASSRTSVVAYQPASQSMVVAAPQTSAVASKQQAAKTPQYGKNATSKSKVVSKAKKPNMTQGKPPAGAPVEGPINHSE